jgi:hypothetical protein
MISSSAGMESLVGRRIVGTVESERQEISINAEKKNTENIYKLTSPKKSNFSYTE